MALGEECGSRLSTNLNDEDDESIALFAKYHEQYALALDTGMKSKQPLVQPNVAILGLDIQEYFYRVSIDFDEVRKALKGGNTSEPASLDDPHPLLTVVGDTHRKAVAKMFLPGLTPEHPMRWWGYPSDCARPS
jgi:hypothetical protein